MDQIEYKLYTLENDLTDLCLDVDFIEQRIELSHNEYVCYYSDRLDRLMEKKR